MVTAAEEAVTQATAEGLTLEQSKNAASGYKGVYEVPGMLAASKKYEAKVTLSGTEVRLGNFATAEEAALAIARAKARTVAPDTAAGEFSTAEEVLTQATAEGLKLEPSTNSSGYRGVSKDIRLIMPFIAALKFQGKRLHLGNFAIVEEAALAVARAKACADVSDAATGRPRPRHPVVSLKLSVCSDSGLVCALAEVLTSCKATVRDADPSWSEDEERERKRTKKEKAPPISHMCLICV